MGLDPSSYPAHLFKADASNASILIHDFTPHLSIEQVRSWLQHCEDHFTCSVVSQSQQLSVVLNLILIDVFDRKLVRGSSGSRYVALSYVSGGVHEIRTVKADVESLHHDGMLGSAGFPLPPLFLDAMSLTVPIGVRYLWFE